MSGLITHEFRPTLRSLIQGGGAGVLIVGAEGGGGGKSSEKIISGGGKGEGRRYRWGLGWKLSKFKKKKKEISRFFDSRKISLPFFNFQQNNSM